MSESDSGGHSQDNQCITTELCSDYCRSTYCKNKPVCKTNRRNLFQFKCVEKFKYEKGFEFNREVRWSEGWMIWVELGYAKKFSTLYTDTIPFLELYGKIVYENSGK